MKFNIKYNLTGKNDILIVKKSEIHTTLYAAMKFF